MSARLDQLGIVFVAIPHRGGHPRAVAVACGAAHSPLYLPPYLVQLLGKYLCYAILAVALDLVWGYCGILSLGHGAFFALGGYAMGMYLMRQIGARGVYANPILPDFMVFLNWKELPVAWWGFNWFPYAMAMVVLVPGLLALAFGWFAFRSRVTGVYLSIITQAMTFALFKEFFRNDFGFGGNNGLTDFKDLLGFSLQSASTKAALFSASAIALILAYRGRRARSSPRNTARRWSRCATRRAGCAFSATGSRTISSSCSSFRPSSQASPARSTCRRSASSIRANSRPRTRSKRRSGSRSAAAGR